MSEISQPYSNSGNYDSISTNPFATVAPTFYHTGQLLRRNAQDDVSLASYLHSSQQQPITILYKQQYALKLYHEYQQRRIFQDLYITVAAQKTRIERLETVVTHLNGGISALKYLFAAKVDDISQRYEAQIAELRHSTTYIAPPLNQRMDALQSQLSRLAKNYAQLDLNQIESAKFNLAAMASDTYLLLYTAKRFEIQTGVNTQRSPRSNVHGPLLEKILEKQNKALDNDALTADYFIDDEGKLNVHAGLSALIDATWISGAQPSTPTTFNWTYDPQQRKISPNTRQESYQAPYIRRSRPSDTKQVIDKNLALIQEIFAYYCYQFNYLGRGNVAIFKPNFLKLCRDCGLQIKRGSHDLLWIKVLRTLGLATSNLASAIQGKCLSTVEQFTYALVVMATAVQSDAYFLSEAERLESFIGVYLFPLYNKKIRPKSGAYDVVAKALEVQPTTATTTRQTQPRTPRQEYQLPYQQELAEDMTTYEAELCCNSFYRFAGSLRQLFSKFATRSPLDPKDHLQVRAVISFNDFLLLCRKHGFMHLIPKGDLLTIFTRRSIISKLEGQGTNDLKIGFTQFCRVLVDVAQYLYGKMESMGTDAMLSKLLNKIFILESTHLSNRP